VNLVQGTRLGRYEIHSQIGAGGMGDVYPAWDTKLDRKVALKDFAGECGCTSQRSGNQLRSSDQS
jgi:hypothetical protein